MCVYCNCSIRTLSIETSTVIVLICKLGCCSIRLWLSYTDKFRWWICSSTSSILHSHSFILEDTQYSKKYKAQHQEYMSTVKIRCGCNLIVPCTLLPPMHTTLNAYVTIKCDRLIFRGSRYYRKFLKVAVGQLRVFKLFHQKIPFPQKGLRHCS